MKPNEVCIFIMLRIRFKQPTDDYRPVKWPIDYPYWCTGYDSYDIPILVAYVESIEQLYELWPEAQDIEQKEVQKIEETSRFPFPDWYIQKLANNSSDISGSN